MRWEYCAVVGLSRKEGGGFANARDPSPNYPVIWYFTGQGILKQEIRGNEAAEFGKAMSALGEQGWEMVGVGALGHPGDTAIYFKRPKP